MPACLLRFPRLLWLASYVAGIPWKETSPATKAKLAHSQKERCKTDAKSHPSCIALQAMMAEKKPPTKTYDESHYNASASHDLILVGSVSRWEQCYVAEWLEYHFKLGVAHVYILPVFGFPLINIPSAGAEPDPKVLQTIKLDDVMRSYTHDDPRVTVLCEVNGRPGSCADASAVSYAEGGRHHQAKLLVEDIAPRHAGGWITVIDLDEFLTVPNASRTLAGVLEEYNRRRITYITVHTLAFGANNVKSNPGCKQLGVFLTAIEPTSCTVPYRHVKTIFRARAGLHAGGKDNAVANAHYFVSPPLPEEHWTGYGMSYFAYGQSQRCRDNSQARCDANTGAMVSAESLPWLQLRHYITRSKAEWDAKMRIYVEDYRTTIKAYREPLASQYFMHADQSWDKGSKYPCRRERVACRPLAIWPEVCPSGTVQPAQHSVPIASTVVVPRQSASSTRGDMEYPPTGNLSASVEWLKQARAAVCASTDRRLGRVDGGAARVASIVTGGSKFNETLHSAAVNNQRCYCEQHGIRLHHVMHDFCGRGSTALNAVPHFNKVFAIAHAMAHESVAPGEWVMWVDRDVLFANLSAPASHVLERELARRPAAGANCHLVAGGMRGGMNNGVLFLRKSCWAMKLLEAWFELRQCMKPPLYDQTAYVIALMTELGYQPKKLAQSLTAPNCNKWGHIKTRWMTWLGESAAYIRNASTSADSHVCLTDAQNPGQGPGEEQLLVHFLGIATFTSTRKCLHEAHRVWRTDAKRTFGEVCPPTASSWPLACVGNVQARNELAVEDAKLHAFKQHAGSVG